MTVEYTIISIGTLGRNRLWGESSAVRTPHATTTLVRNGERLILVDPSLPGPILQAKYNERTGGSLADVTDVFCTTLRPVHRRSIDVFDGATWWAPEAEIETYAQHLAALLDAADRLDPPSVEAAEADLDLVRRFKLAPDTFGSQISLYPLAGPSPGSAGLLLTPPTSSVVIAGDAAVTAEHVAQGQVWDGCTDAEAALTSLQDILEIGDVIVPGHDNIMIAQRQWL